METINDIKEIYKAIKNECVSYGEIAYLQAHTKEIKKYFGNEPLLWEWAGIPEKDWIKQQQRSKK